VRSIRRTLIVILATAAAAISSAGFSQTPKTGITEDVTKVPAAYTPPANNRLKFNFNMDWKFIKSPALAKTDKPEAAAFDDAKWADVTLPHTFNDVDTFYDKEKRSDMKRQWSGVVWYRKHFTLDANWEGRKVFLEFEGIRNTGVFYVNGKLIGQHSNQVGPCGLDITDAVKFGADNVISVSVDNNMLAKNPKGFSYGWSAQAFYPNYGGLFKDASLHITDKVYQTLPLYSNLKTQGVYVWADNIDTGKGTAEITAESEVANETGAAANVTLEAWAVDRDGKTVFTKTAAPQSVAAGAKAKLTISTPMSGIHFWHPDYPYVYRFYTSLSVNGKVVDVVENPLGVRKLTFSAKEGLKVNGHPIYLKGWAPRTMMEWAVSGIPQNWMVEYDYKLMKENNTYFIRPMHVAPRKNLVESADKFGIVMVCPAGNGEGDDPDNEQGNARWQDRLEVMRDVTIYFRNNPSVWFWEASNSGIRKEHMEDMVKVKEQWDPHGGRYAGTRGTGQDIANVQEYGSPMDTPRSSKEMPSWDAEYARAECPRRVWDKYTPFLNEEGKFVVGGLIKVATPEHANGGGNGIFEYPVDQFRLNSSEDLALNNTRKYWDRYKTSAIVQGPSASVSKGVMAGGAKIFFADSNSDGRLRDMEVARTTGNVDAVRLPKESYYALQVAHNNEPQVYVIGHWNYQAGTVKNVWVVANTEKVKLVTYNADGSVAKDYGFGTLDDGGADKKENKYNFLFKNVAFAPGKIEAVGINGDKQAATHSKSTAGAPVALKMTPVAGPGEWRADGADIVLVDVEAVDANGNRCPTEEGRVDMEHAGNGVYMGSYNSGVRHSTWKDNFNIECGINRVLVRSTRTAGEFKLTAKREGLKSATITLTSVPFETRNGLATAYSRRYGYVMGAEPKLVADEGVLLAGRSKGPVAAAGNDKGDDKLDQDAVMREFNYTGTQGDTLTPPMPVAHIERNARDGAQIYVDEKWTFEKLPKYLVGGDYVQAFQRDATENTSTDQIQFFTNKPCHIYILVDAANKMPVFNNNDDYKWSKQKETVTINGRKHEIYKSREVGEGYNGYFASNGKGIELAKGSNQYVVIAVPVKP
jgi:beta-galactosidase